MLIPIIPIPFGLSSGVYVRVNDGHVRLSDTADFQWQVLDTGHQPVSIAARYTLTTDQYNAWGASDEALAQSVVSSVGYSPIITGG